MVIEHGTRSLALDGPLLAQSRKEPSFKITIDGKRVLFLNARSGFAVQEALRLMT